MHKASKSASSYDSIWKWYNHNVRGITEVQEWHHSQNKIVETQIFHALQIIA